MGYYASWYGDICVKKENMDACLKAINDLHTPEVVQKKGGGFTSFGGVTTRHYAWVGTPPEGGFKTLEDAFKAWTLFDDWTIAPCDGEFYIEGYHDSKVGDEKVFLQTIAPYVEDTRFECSGEDGALWLWEIKDGTFTEKTGRVVYD